MPNQDSQEPSLRDSIAAAMDAPESTSAASTSQPAADPPASADAKPADGAPAAAPTTAAATTADTSAAAPKLDADGKPIVTDARSDVSQAAATLAGAKALKPPVSFPDVREWEKMPEPIRKWVRDREVQFNRGLQANAENAKFGSAIWQELQPYEATIRSSGAHPVKLVAEMAATHYLLTMGSPQQRNEAFVRAAQRYGIDLTEVAGVAANGGGAAKAPANPEVAALQKTVGELLQRIRGNDRQQSEATAQHVWNDVNKFVEDPQFEHVGILWSRMADLLERGLANDLPDAYEQALWTRPDLRAIQIEKDAARRAKEAQNARNAGTGGAGHPVAAATAPTNESLRGALERAWDAAA